MKNLKIYLMIIAATVLVLWLTSIIIYWDYIGTYISQSVGGLISSGMELVIVVVVFMLIISMILGIFRR